MKTTTMLLALALAVGACSKEKEATPKAAPSAPAAGQTEEKKGDDHDGEKHAAAGVKPGSHEDWCVEHAVPESQCTRCNAELIPAFKATGDWCDEHGLPMSQCLKHNPDLKIVRPPKE